MTAVRHDSRKAPDRLKTRACPAADSCHSESNCVYMNRRKSKTRTCAKEGRERWAEGQAARAPTPQGRTADNRSCSTEESD